MDEFAGRNPHERRQAMRNGPAAGQQRQFGMKIGGELGYRLLRRLYTGRDSSTVSVPGCSYIPRIRAITGDEGWSALQGKKVLDFGCGRGAGSIEMAEHGATHVIGLDIREDVLAEARLAAQQRGVSENCSFVESVVEPVDVIVSVDAFEHFENPASILEIMDRLLKDDGVVLLSFGPTWYHPHGGHLFSVFPWSHLIFSEQAQIRWRSDFKDDGATRFSEVPGGLNEMTIARFLKLVDDSSFELQSFHAVPIRPLRWLHNRWTREFTTSMIECKLVKRHRSH